MKTARLFGWLTLALIPLLAGCEDDGYVAADYTVVAYDLPRYEYHVTVSVTDAWGFPVTFAGVELVVADIPEYAVYGTTDHYGMCSFWIDAPAGTVVSVFVDAHPFGSDYFTVITDAYSSDMYVDVRL